MIRPGVALVFGLGVAALAAHASAQGSSIKSSEPLRVDYRREGACPDGDAFFGAVRARTEKARPATSGEAARTLKVTVAEEARGSRGTLAIVAADGASSTSVREVRAATCDDVVSALALVAALAIDPEARTTPVALAPAPSTSASSAPDAGVSDAAPPPAPAASASSSSSSSSNAPSVPTTSTPTPSTPTPSTPTPRRGPPETPSSKPATLGFEVGLGAEGSTVLATRPAFSLLIGLDIARDSLVSPAFTLRASRSLAGTAATSAGSASFVFSSVALEPCPVRVRLTESVAFLPCARLAVGYVDAAGSGITTPSNATRLWGDVGAHARLNVAIARFLSLDLNGGLRVPLSRDRYYVEPDATVYEIPAMTFAFGGDVRLRF